MASDRGVGLKAGYQAACQDGFWVCDQFMSFKTFLTAATNSNAKPIAPLARSSKPLETFANAKSEANLQKAS